MAKMELYPGFFVEPGNCSLRVVTLDFLKSRGISPNKGVGFKADQAARYGGKKLKLYSVSPSLKYEDGAKFRLFFSKDNSDRFQWNEYMFEQYWIARDQAEKAAGPVKENRSPEKDTCSCRKEDDKIKVLANEIDSLVKENKNLAAGLVSATRKIESYERKFSEFERVFGGLSERIGTLENMVEDNSVNIQEIYDKVFEEKPKNKDNMMKLLLLSSLLGQKPTTQVTPVEAPTETPKV